MASMKTTFPLSILLLLLLSESISLEAIGSFSSVGNSTVGCIEMEREALLKFKNGLEDPSNWLSSWVGEDCCDWMGVSCSNHTGNVVKLDLKDPDFRLTPIDFSHHLILRILSTPHKRRCLSGELNPSLLDLKYLNYLDLSNHNFSGMPIPHFVGSLNKLSYLNLSNALFAGMVPPSLGNLSNLRHLDLSSPVYYNSLDLDLSTGVSHYSLVSKSPLWVSDLNWLSGLTSLQYLTLNGVNLSKATNHWLQSVNRLPSLLELSLSDCQLHSLPQTLPFVNFTSLSVLHLPLNFFNSYSIPPWLFNITSLTILDLSSCLLEGPIANAAWGNLCHLQSLDLKWNSINGEITKFVRALLGCSNNSLEALALMGNEFSGNLPYSLGYFKHLKFLEVSSNSISGPIPSSIGNLSLLTYLYLSENMMNGTIPESIGQLTELQTLDLFSNSWEGIITKTHFLNLTKLEEFILSSTNNSLSLNIAHDWIPPPNVYTLIIRSCKLGPAFPAWLRNLKSLMFLTLTNTAVSNRVPDWFWNLSSQIFMLDLSHNKLSGELPKSLNFFFIPKSIDLGFNHFEGLVPLWYNVTRLSLRNNLLSGSIPVKLTQEMSQLKALDLSGNFIIGSIPPSINRLKELQFLDLSNNHLSGKIPNHWKGMQQLGIIDLSKNNLSGGVPSSMCSLPSLHWLQLSNNNLYGDLSFLQNGTKLNALDLGENRFSGTIPKWIGERLLLIEGLRLRGNMLFGNIPEQLCNLTLIIVLDLGHNNLSGSIPTCLGRLIRLKHSGIYFKHEIISINALGYSTHMDLFVKGRQFEFTDQIISIQRIVDLLQNNLSGEIPTTLTDLVALNALNLSRNQLTGKIPENIGALQSLETLDLSCNHLSGPIPPSMPSMTFLSHLNLSNNNLSGQIPSANQFLTLDDPSIYEGNPLLCGPPLPAKCLMPNDGGANNKHKEDVDEDDEEGYEKFWFYVSLVLGFIVGFWTVCGSLVIKKSWRDAYFRFIDQMKDRLYVVVAVNMARLRRKIKGERQ